MKKLITILLLALSINCFATGPDSLKVHTFNSFSQSDQMRTSNGVLTLITGALFTAIGVFSEHNRVDHVPHPNTIDWYPNAARNLNYTVTGIGAGMMLTGTLLVIKF
jgi:hypothetical protein